MYTNKEVAKLASMLGFEKKRKMRGTVIFWNDTTIERLRNQYGVIEKDEKHEGMNEEGSQKEGSIFATTP